MRARKKSSWKDETSSWPNRILSRWEKREEMFLCYNRWPFSASTELRITSEPTRAPCRTPHSGTCNHIIKQTLTSDHQSTCGSAPVTVIIHRHLRPCHCILAPRDTFVHIGTKWHARPVVRQMVPREMPLYIGGSRHTCIYWLIGILRYASWMLVPGGVPILHWCLT